MDAEGEQNEEFVRLLMSIQKPLRGFIYAHVHDTSLTDDILQEVSVVLWRKHDQYDPARPFLGWALGIARNEILHANRQSARSRLVFDDELAAKLATCYEETGPELEQRRALLDECLQRLSDEARNLMEMRYGSGMRMKEISKRMKKTVTAVTVAISRIRTALMECVDRNSGEETGVAGGEP